MLYPNLVLPNTYSMHLKALCPVSRLVVFAFFYNLLAENSKVSADSGIHEIQLLECMEIEEGKFEVETRRERGEFEGIEGGEFEGGTRRV